MRRLGFIALLGLFAAWVGAAAEVRDLGADLGYLRLRDVDREAFSATTRALVLDLREATSGNGAGAERLRGLLAPGAVRFVLVSARTAPAILALLEARPPSVLTIGGREAPPVDIVVSVSEADDRRAYDSLEQGANLAELANPPLVKARRDEASILRARRGSNGPPGAPPPPAGTTAPPAEPPASPDAPAPAATTEPAAPPAPRGDAVLQRAVQLHRGLMALKRL